ncbi:MAG: hypothetical protein AB8B82_15805 [Roseovarius sp.]
MGTSILRMPRTQKHGRLFELIRQGNLADKTTADTRRKAAQAPKQDLQVLQQAATRSLQS